MFPSQCRFQVVVRARLHNKSPERDRFHLLDHNRGRFHAWAAYLDRFHVLAPELDRLHCCASGRDRFPILAPNVFKAASTKRLSNLFVSLVLSDHLRHIMT